MEDWINILLPFVLVLSRVGAFVGVSPIFGWRALPWVVRAGIALLLTFLFASILSPALLPAPVHWFSAVILISQEVVIGLALGLATRFIYSIVRQGALIAARQMGVADAGVFDPVSGARSQPIATLFEMIFTILFLSAGGHRILLMVLGRGFDLFPIAGSPNIPVLTGGLVKAGSEMLLFGLKFAAPVLGGFLILAVLLSILARALPEMNILLASFPLRVGLGLFMAAAIMPTLSTFTTELARMMNRFFVPT